MDIIDCHCEDDDFHPDVTPIVLAAQRNNFSMIKVGTYTPQRMNQDLSVMHCVNYWYLNLNRRSSEQQLLKTVVKDGFETKITNIEKRINF